MTAAAPLARQKPDRRRRDLRGKLNVSPELPDIPGVEFGPAMRALPSDKHRQFVLNLYLVKPGYGSHVAAAKMAGFGSSTSTPQSWASIASRLAHDDKIQAAIFEEDQKRIRSTAPRAIFALQNLIEDPTHKDHARGIGMLLDRVHPPELRTTIDVHHHVDHTAETLLHLRYLKSLNVSHEVLEREFGFSGLGRYERLLALEDAKTKVVEGKPEPPGAVGPKAASIV